MCLAFRSISAIAKRCLSTLGGDDATPSVTLQVKCDCASHWSLQNLPEYPVLVFWLAFLCVFFFLACFGFQNH